MKNCNKNKLIEILKECYTKADLCRVLDLKPTGENYRQIDLLIEKYNLTWDNYLGRSYKKGKHVLGTKHLVGTTGEPPIHYKSLCNDD